MTCRLPVRRLAAALLLSFASVSALAGWDYETSISGGWEQVTERDAGQNLVKEQGPGAGVAASLVTSVASWRFDLSGGVAGAALDYDGSTQLGSPLATDTEWFGWHAGAGVERRFLLGFPVRIGAGVEYQWRQRNIQPTEGVDGLEERYRTVWLGIRGAVRPAGFSTLELNAGCALMSSVHVGLPGPLDTTKLALSDHCRAGAGIDLVLGRPGGRVLFLRPFARWERYPRSDAERLTANGVGVGTVYLPSTELVSFGISVGIRRRQ